MKKLVVHKWIALCLLFSGLTCGKDLPDARPDYMADLELEREFEIGGRKAFLYKHAKGPQGAVPFYVVPADGTIPNPPLHVVLHHAGGSGPQAIKEAFAAKHRHQYVAKEHCALYLDCRSVKADWW